MTGLFAAKSLRPFWFVAGSVGLTLAPFWLGQRLWPEGLSANAANFFWPASGFNLALVLRWGPRYAPLILLNAPAAVLLMGLPLPVSAVGAGLNALEVLLGNWILRRFARGMRNPVHLQSVLVFCGTSVAMGFAVGLPLAGTLVWLGGVPPEQFGQTVLGIAAANACAVLFITPVFLASPRASSPGSPFTGSFLAGALVLAGIGLVLFPTVFEGRFNYAFALFPVMMFAAIRFSFAQNAWYLLLLMALVYAGLALNAGGLPPERAPEILWFVQAFSWVLAAAVLVLTALAKEKQLRDVEALAHENELLESRLRENRARLAALRHQVDPHFLHNALNSVCEVLETEPRKARPMITRISTYFRETMAVEEGETVTVEKAVREMALYLEIEKSRYEDALQIRLEIDPAVAGQMIPAFLLQPLVENAMRHGFMQGKGVFELRIGAAPVPEGRFHVEVEHPGRWRKEDPQRTGVGLENIRERLRLLYEGEASLETLLNGGRVCQRLTFPVRKDPET